MAHTKAKGSTKLGRDSNAQRLGVKVFGGEKVNAGQILIRQRGSKWYAGKNVRQAGDDTLYAQMAGIVTYQKKKITGFDGQSKRKTIVHIEPVSLAK